MGRDRKNSYVFGRPRVDSGVGEVQVVGLVNLGNSCFYNTILQSLAATTSLNYTISHPPSSSPSLLALSPASPSRILDPSQLSSPLPLTEALISALARLDPKQEEGKGKAKVFNPKALLRALSLKHKEYATSTQEDAHQLLRHLIDGIMMEEVDLIKKTLSTTPPLGKRSSLSKRRMTIKPSSFGSAGTGVDRPIVEKDSGVKIEREHGTLVEEPESVDGEEGDDEDGLSSSSDAEEDEEEEEDTALENDEEESDESSSTSSSSSDEGETFEERVRKKKLKKELEKKKKSMRPFVDEVFGGKLASLVICDECKNVSLTQEDFMDLSLSLKDNDANLRKRDRIRKSLQANFFSKRSDSLKSPSSSSSPLPPLQTRREPISLSEAEASASPSGSEFESDEAEDPRIARARRKSLDPTLMRDRRPLGLSQSQGQNGGGGGGSTANSRDASPLGRAISLISGNGRPSGGGKRKVPKIPKPTKEQTEYIKHILADVPGPATSPLPSQLRWSRPPGSTSTSSDQPSPTTSTSSTSSTSLSSSHRHSFPTPTDPKFIEASKTDLYQCLRAFTAVETLEGENSFACKNCWRLLNPDKVERRKLEREERKKEREGRRRERSATVVSGGAGERERSGTVVSGGGPVRVDEERLKRLREEEEKGVELTTKDEKVFTTDFGTSPPTVPTPPTPSSIDATSTPTLGDSPAALISSISLDSATSTISSQVESVESQLADVEDSGSVSEGDGDVEEGGSGESGSVEDVVAKGLPPAKPLTTENVEALEVVTSGSGQGVVGTPSVTISSAPPLSPTSTNPELPSGASLSTRPSGASLSTAPSVSISLPPKASRHILRRAHKRYLISPSSLPQTLVIHLKRFMQTSKGSYFGTAFSNLKKRDDEVSFSEDLDLSPFLAPVGKPPKGREERDRERMEKGRKEVKSVVGGRETAHYRLYGVVVHIGSLGSGHYVAYVLSDHYTPSSRSKDETSTTPPPRKWFYTSDEMVRAASVDEVLGCKAYILFYERVTNGNQSTTTASGNRSRM